MQAIEHCQPWVCARGVHAAPHLARHAPEVVRDAGREGQPRKEELVQVDDGEPVGGRVTNAVVHRLLLRSPCAALDDHEPRPRVLGGPPTCLARAVVGGRVLDQDKLARALERVRIEPLDDPQRLVLEGRDYAPRGQRLRRLGPRVAEAVARATAHGGMLAARRHEETKERRGRKGADQHSKRHALLAPPVPVEQPAHDGADH